MFLFGDFWEDKLCGPEPTIIKKELSLWSLVVGKNKGSSNPTWNQSTGHNSKVKARAAAPGNYTATFDQCCVGLKSPSGKAMQKRTNFLTNMRSLYDALNGNFCQGLHEHEPIQGSENGIRRSQHAQIYPDGLVNTICEVVLKSHQR